MSKVLHAPSNVAFECMLHAIRWAYQDRDKGLKFSSNQSPVPISWYDATNKEDATDSLALGGGLHMMCGAAVSFFFGKHKHVGISGSTNCEYMALERNMRTTVWLIFEYFHVLKIRELYSVQPVVIHNFGSPV